MRVASVLACLLLTGCSFPDPPIGPADASLDTTAPDTTADVADTFADADASTNDGDATVDGDTSVGDTDLDVKTDGDAKVDGDAADTLPDFGPDADPCDKDGDGFKAKGGACGGTDCDDFDKRANPGVTAFQTFDATGTPHLGDWNCDGTTERQYPKTNINCGVLGGATCDTTKGFKDDPACGAGGTYVECGTSGVFCVEKVNKPETQGCR